MKKKADLLLHPVRIRIVQALLSNEKMTVYQLIDYIGDVPQATMYRHLSILTEANIVKVVETRQVRGTVEKIYGVEKEAIVIPEDETDHLTPEEHLRYFMAYHASLLKEVETYLFNEEGTNHKKDGFGYWHAPIYLSEEEMDVFSSKYKKLVEEAAQNKPTPNRKSITLASMFIPRKSADN